MDFIEDTPRPDSSVTQNQCLKKGKTDPACDHCTEIPAGDKKQNNIVCMFYQKHIKGGGIDRFKQHLAGITSEIASCTRVNAQVRFEMKKAFESTCGKNKRGAAQPTAPSESYSQNNFTDYEEQLYMTEDENDAQEHTQSTHTFANAKRNGVAYCFKKVKTIDSMFMPKTTHGGQLGLKSVLQSKAKKEKVDLVVSKWMINSSISFNASNSAYYQEMFDAVAYFEVGYKGPTFHDLRGFLLKKNVELVKNYVNSFCKTWKNIGCTVMADGWSDKNRRSIINFLVYCPGTVFLKSVDASYASKL